MTKPVEAKVGEEEKKELMLKEFMYQLDEAVFIKNTDSVSGKVKYLHPKIEDLEAVIRISGEWDREDLKNIIYYLTFFESESQRQERIVRESAGENEYVGPTK